MTLILTEKPSVAGDFAKALRATRKDGHYENSHYVITYCVGHLLELYAPEDYGEKYGKPWRLEALPIVPERYKYRPVKKTEDQLEHVRKLLASSSVREVVVATDAGREGELIARLVLNYAGVRDMSLVKRFWSSEALTPEVVQAGMKRLQPISETDGLYASGYYRQVADWLIGMNFTRFFTLKLGAFFSVGRVQTAVLGLLVRRQREIEGFVPEPYFRLAAFFDKRGQAFKAFFERNGETKFDSKALLLPIVEDALSRATSGTVASVAEKQHTKQPPQLLNLTALQRAANQKYGYSADKTLSTAQALYEKHKCLSYPRTPSRVLGESDTEFARAKLQAMQSAYAEMFNETESVRIEKQDKRIFNNAQLEDHHALVPLAPLPADAGEAEAHIFDIVLRSFAAAFSPAYEYSALTAYIDVESLRFVARGKAVRVAGWTNVYASDDEKKSEEEEDEVSLPKLAEGDTVRFMDSKIEEKQTKPPAWFSEASLLGAMENPSKHMEHKDGEGFEKGSGIGTQATRAAIIETLLKREYVRRAKKRLVVTEKGAHLFDALSSYHHMRRFTEVDETARWEGLLHTSPREFYQSLEKFVRATLAGLSDDGSLKRFEGESVGKCPKCGAAVVERRDFFGCSAYRESGCDFKIWKQFAGMKETKDKLTVEDVKKLLSGKKTRAKKFFSKKKDKAFEAHLVLNGEFGLDMKFEDGAKKGSAKQAAGKKR